MNLNGIFKETNEDYYLVETIKKQHKRYFVYSHKEKKKKIGKEIGYESVYDATKALLGMMSKGGFLRKTLPQQEVTIKNYIKRHKLEKWHNKDQKKRDGQLRLVKIK